MKQKKAAKFAAFKYAISLRVVQKSNLDPLEERAAHLLGVGGREELLGVDVAFEQAALHQGGDAGLDHDWRAAQVGLAVAEIVVEAAPWRLHGRSRGKPVQPLSAGSSLRAGT